LDLIWRLSIAKRVAQIFLGAGLLAGPLAHAHAKEVHANTTTTLGRQVVLHANAPSVSPTHSARALYVLHCAGCHGLDGSGSASARVPDMRQLGQFLRVPGGREFLIQVPGVMGSGLNDEQVAQVTNWVLSSIANASMVPHHQAFNAAEVSQARRNPLVNVAATRAVLVQRAQALGLQLAQTP
jgi:mono/diheme cytochrome c family protein